VDLRLGEVVLLPRAGVDEALDLLEALLELTDGFLADADELFLLEDVEEGLLEAEDGLVLGGREVGLGGDEVGEGRAAEGVGLAEVEEQLGDGDAAAGGLE